jgi:hypothetical protein
MNPSEDSMRVVRSVIAVAVCVSLVFSCGCAGQRLHTMAWFPAFATGGEVKQVAPQSGVYKVKFSTRLNDDDEDDLHTLGGTRRVLHQGDFIGFAKDGDGQLYAIAGEEKFPVRQKPGARRVPAYFVWSYKTEKQPKFDAGDWLADVGLAVLFVGAVVGVGALVLWSWSQEDDDCGCWTD